MGRAGWVLVAFVACALALSCSLITKLDEPRAEDAGAPPADGAPVEAAVEAAVCGDTSSNPSNCGACGLSCLGGACEGGVCAPVVVADIGPSANMTGIFVDPATATVYATASAAGAVYAVPADAGPDARAAVALSGIARPVRVTGFDRQNGTSSVYVASGNPHGAPGGVYEIDSDGGTSALVASPATIGTAPVPVWAWGVALSAGASASLYWMNTIGPDGGEQAQVVQTQLGTRASALLATVDGGVGHDIAVTATGDVWFNNGGAELFVLPAGTSAPIFVTGNAGIFGYSPGTTGGAPPQIFFSDSNGGTTVGVVGASDLGKLTTTIFAATDVSAPFAFASDGAKYLYWTNATPAPGSIARRAFAANSVPEMVTKSPAPPKQIAYDAKQGALFWTTDGAIVRWVPPP
jgi:hypothetical protein